MGRGLEATASTLVYSGGGGGLSMVVTERKWG